MGFSAAHFTEQQPDPQRSDVNARVQTSDQWRDQCGKEEITHEFHGMSDLSDQTVRGVVFVMNVVIFTEHSLVMEQTVNPIEQGVFEEVEKHKLRAEFRPTRELQSRLKITIFEYRIAEEHAHWQDNNEMLSE